MLNNERLLQYERPGEIIDILMTSFMYIPIFSMQCKILFFVNNYLNHFPQLAF